MNALEIADFLEENMMVVEVLLGDVTIASIILTIRHQHAEIEALKKSLKEYNDIFLGKAQSECNGFCGEYECKENQSNCKRKKAREK